ncbi:MAG: tetratricopeptide repeat protein, partial [Candidatus Acidiferrales bacterium]
TEVAPFRLLSSNLRGKKALVIPSDGSAPRLFETPPDPPFPSTQHVTIEGSISELGKLEALVSYVLRGDNELPLRMAFRRTPQSRWKELGQVVAYSDGLGGAVTDVNPSDPADTSIPFRLEYRVSITNFLDWSSKQSQLRLPLPSIGMPPADADLAPDDDPIKLGTPTDVVTRLKLTIPEKYSARAPVPVGLKRDYAEYRSDYKVEGQVISAERALRFRMREVPAARVRDYVSFARAVDSDEAQSVSITSTVAGTPTIPEAAKTDELFQAARAAVQNANLKMAAELYKRVVEKDPKYKGAWLELGTVHSVMRQFDEAIAAFNKQIELNPYDERAYNSLGSVFRQQQKFDDAIKAFRKQLEISPLDQIAHIQLGDVYRETKRYDEAVVMLERAVVLAPRDAGLFVSLGDCYLNLKQPEKALEAFDKGLEISSSPTMLNNVAYQLALHRTHLDRAQQYAESAVASTAAQLRNVSLARLTQDQLSRVNSLAAYWDTLGWVLFQRGDLDRAEKYTEASWLLAYHGEVGDHLAQIAEKRGKKEKAAQLYAQALAASRPNSETRARLAALIADEKKIDDLMRKAGEHNSLERTVKLGPLVKERASAEFFVLLAPVAGAADSPSAGPASRWGATVEDVKFISGDERLRPFADKLRSANFDATFPDDTPTKLVRRGMLSCTPAMGCSFVLIVPDDVTSVN